MKFDVLTLFPEMFESLNESILGRAIEKDLININLTNIRDFSKDKHKKVDDTPYGGGAGMVLIFMLLYYQFRGLAADLALIVTILLIFAGLIAFKATLTLPGIAGIILTLGMAVDGNVLIYERVREERNAGKTPAAALESGFRKALVTILDSNITTLIAALVLFYFGSGSVRGFGVTLSIGLVASVFANIVVTRAILQLFIRNKIKGGAK